MKVLLQVDWLQQFLGSPDSILSKAVLWAGIQAVPSRAAPMEAVLRSKCILLLAVTWKRRAVRLASNCIENSIFSWVLDSLSPLGSLNCVVYSGMLADIML